MAEPTVVDNGALADYSVLVDDVVDATLGTGAKQLVGLVDGTIGSTTKIVAGGGVEAGALRVTVASDSTGVLSVDDNGGSLTVDAPVGTPAFVRLSDGAAAITTLPVSLASVPSHAVTGPLTDTELRATAVPVSAASLPLPTGAATAAKQPALGTAGTASADVITIQGIASGTAVAVALAAGTNTNEVVGDAAHDAPIAGNPVRIAGRALTADYTAVAAGDVADLITTLLGKQVVIPYCLPGQMWSYAAPAGGLVSQVAVTIKAAAGAGIRNYITHIDVVNSHATISTELVINDGAAGTVLWRGWLQAAGGGYSINFDPPLRGTANTLLEIDEVTATGTTGVLFNCVGFTAAE